MAAAERSRHPRTRVPWAEETLRAIRAGEVDAFVVRDRGGHRTVELRGNFRPYRVLIERMNEGALTLAANGTILYCNQRFADLVRRKRNRLLGSPLRELLPEAERAALDVLIARARRGGTAGEFALRRGARHVPVTLSLGPAGDREGRTRLVAVVTDASERHRAARLRMTLQRRLLVAADEERRALARELHDETGQSLTALLIRLRGLEDAATLDEARHAARDLRELTSRTLEEVGRLARGLHPGVLDELGLVTAITRHIEDFEQTHGVAVTFKKSGVDDRRVPSPIATTLYRLLQESLTNVARHAHARRVRIDLSVRNARVRLTLKDDGRGMDVNASHHSGGTRAAPRGHLGLIGMRERTALFGGSFEVRSKTGKGTTISAQFPLDGMKLRRTVRSPEVHRNGKQKISR